ncbi:MAG: lectin like domain-containing protein [candidate division Zixibacteria bacterium]|nr:lectin like domain-containing protein [candidate division Zixibacteria bacterium]
MKSKIISTMFILGLFVGAAVMSAVAQTPQIIVGEPVEHTVQPEGRGYIPPMVDMSHLTGTKMPPPVSAAAPPAQWDWRAEGKVTPVKNQGACGSCYAFASIANIESKMLIDGGATFDFSENNAKECNWYDRSCGGGNFIDVANYLAKQGTALEACDAYVAANVACNTSCLYQKTLLDWRIISGSAVPSTAVLKQYIYDNGPVYTTVYTGDANDAAWESEYNSYNGTYTLYYNGTWPINHAVLIVGWDDALVHDGGTGAWIVKNSWGTGWGGTCGYGVEGGYFTIAYGSANIGMYSSYMQDWMDYDPNGQLMFHDEGGWTGYVGYGNVTAWGLCKFVPTQTRYLTRVEFWTNDATTDVDVYVYDDFNGTTVSNLLASQLDNVFAEAGYHSVALDAAPEIADGNAVYVVVKFTNAGYIYPLVLDTQGPNLTQTTYMSSNGGSGTWIDVGVNYAYDLGIRARFSPTFSLSVDDGDGSLPEDIRLWQNYPNPFNPGTIISYSIPSRSHVEIAVFNLLGQRVKTLVSESKAAGSHTVAWDGTDEAGREVASGVYLYRLIAGENVKSEKMLLLK